MTAKGTTTVTSTILTRLRDHAVSDRAELDRLLDDTVLAHVGMADDQGGAVVIPTSVVRDGDSVLVHGPDLRPGIPVPASVQALTGRHQWRARDSH